MNWFINCINFPTIYPKAHLSDPYSQVQHQYSLSALCVGTAVSVHDTRMSLENAILWEVHSHCLETANKQI